MPEVLHVCMSLHRWDGCELMGCPHGIFDGLSDGSIGFIAVYDDVEKLRAADPDAEIFEVERIDEV